MPRDLHAELTAEAWREQLSLTEWIRHLLYERGKLSRISVRARETQG
jgi:predicted HicB family RNase H-like nuclease